MLAFHLDEHVHPAIASGLQRRGIDVTTTVEVGLGGSEDEQHVAYALAQDRVIVTHDDDFLALHSRGVPHAGIAYCHQGERTIGDILRHLLLMNECLGPKDMFGRIEFI
jgi:predicted nuclease of predicted toxin-antitoxin system